MKLGLSGLINGTWFEVMRDEGYAHGMDCIEFDFEYVRKNKGRNQMKLQLEYEVTTTKAKDNKTIDMMINSKGEGTADFGWSEVADFQILLIDYDHSALLYSCETIMNGL